MPEDESVLRRRQRCRRILPHALRRNVAAAHATWAWSEHDDVLLPTTDRDACLRALLAASGEDTLIPRRARARRERRLFGVTCGMRRPGRGALDDRAASSTTSAWTCARRTTRRRCAVPPSCTTSSWSATRARAWARATDRARLGQPARAARRRSRASRGESTRRRRTSRALPPTSAGTTTGVPESVSVALPETTERVARQFDASAPPRRPVDEAREYLHLLDAAWDRLGAHAARVSRVVRASARARRGGARVLPRLALPRARRARHARGRRAADGDRVHDGRARASRASVGDGRGRARVFHHVARALGVPHAERAGYRPHALRRRPRAGRLPPPRPPARARGARPGRASSTCST